MTLEQGMGDKDDVMMVAVADVTPAMFTRNRIRAARKTNRKKEEKLPS